MSFSQPIKVRVITVRLCWKENPWPHDGIQWIDWKRDWTLYIIIFIIIFIIIYIIIYIYILYIYTHTFVGEFHHLSSYLT